MKNAQNSTKRVKNTGNSGVSVEWSNSLAPDGWEVGFSNPPNYLGPLESVNISVGIKPPINQPVSDSVFDLGIYATIDNGFDTLQVSVTYPVEVLAGGFCALDYDLDTRPLLGIVRGEEAKQTVTVTNIGNIPLDTSITKQLDAKGWDIDMSEDTISGLGVGESLNIEITATSTEDTASGIKELQLSASCLADESKNSIVLQISVENTKSQGGLFGIVSPAVAYSIITGLVLLVGVVAFRIKRSAPKDLSGEELVAPDAHSIPDDGLRMQAVMLKNH